MGTAHATTASKFLLPLLSAVATLLVACGSGGQGRSAVTDSSITGGVIASSSSGSASLAGVTVTPGDAMIAKGTWRQYTATAVDTDGSKQDVTATATWNVSDPAIASVDAAGRVTGLAPGYTVVYAALSGATAAAPVTVTDAVLQSISLSPTDVAVPLLIDQRFAATGIFSDLTQQDLTAQVTWASSSPAVATISVAGLARPVSVGSTVIQASHGNVSASTNLVVTNATLQYVDVEPAVATVAAGFSIAFDAVATFSDYSEFDVTAQATWTSDSSSAAFPGAPGVAKGISRGSANITASFGGMSDSASLTVSDAVLQAITIEPASPSVPSGLELNLAAMGSFSDGSTQDLTAFVAWSSSDSAVASVSNAAGSEGLLSAISGGSATVTARLNGISGATTVTVTGAAITSIDVTADSSRLPAGYKLQYKAVANFDDGSRRDITAFATWTSSNTSFATVYTSSSLAGLVSGIAPGTVSINAALGGHAGSAALIVTNARLQSVVASPDSLSLGVGAKQQLKATGQFDDGSTLDLTMQCNWRSQTKSVASVTKQGLVTGLRASNTPATILVRKGHFTDTASVQVR